MLDREFVHYVKELTDAIMNIERLKHVHTVGPNADMLNKLEDKLLSKGMKLIRPKKEVK